MSELRNHFRVKSGEIEIEYEGPLNEVNKRYDKALEWLASQHTSSTAKREKDQTTPDLKKDKRGGARKPIYGEKIDELVEEGFFSSRKSLDEVVKGLVPKNVPTRDAKARHAILTNLRRKIASKDAKLKGATEQDIWYFWVD